jgi:hypothetical protein
VTVDLTGTIQMLHQHITKSLCCKLFERVRTKQRQWGLCVLVWFWIQVIMHAPKSLTQALQESAAGRRCRRRLRLFPSGRGTCRRSSSRYCRKTF